VLKVGSGRLRVRSTRVKGTSVVEVSEWFIQFCVFRVEMKWE
jgi:hypothetical protein